MNTFLCLFFPWEWNCNICFSTRKAGKTTLAWLSSTWSCRVCQEWGLLQLTVPSHCRVQGCCRSSAPVEQRQTTGASLESGDKDSEHESTVCAFCFKNNCSIYSRPAATYSYWLTHFPHWTTNSRKAEPRNKQPTWKLTPRKMTVLSSKENSLPPSGPVTHCTCSFTQADSQYSSVAGTLTI